MGCRKLQFEEQFFFVKDNKSKNKGFSFCGNLDSKTSENNTSFGDLQKAFSFVKPVETPLKKLPVNTHECVKQKKRYKSVFYDEQVGKNLFSANVTNPASTDMLYSGEQFDPNLQIQYLRARYYDQSNGRFNRLDPFNGNMGDPQSLHKYAYCHGNPIMGTDPSGNNIFWFVLGGIGLVAFIGLILIAAHNTAEYVQKTNARRAVEQYYLTHKGGDSDVIPDSALQGVFIYKTGTVGESSILIAFSPHQAITPPTFDPDLHRVIAFKARDYSKQNEGGTFDIKILKYKKEIDSQARNWHFGVFDFYWRAWEDGVLEKLTHPKNL